MQARVFFLQFFTKNNPDSCYVNERTASFSPRSLPSCGKLCGNVDVSGLSFSVEVELTFLGSIQGVFLIISPFYVNTSLPLFSPKRTQIPQDIPSFFNPTSSTNERRLRPGATFPSQITKRYHIREKGQKKPGAAMAPGRNERVFTSAGRCNRRRCQRATPPWRRSKRRPPWRPAPGLRSGRGP